MTKYRNKKTVINGTVFDSRREATYWLKLLTLEATGAITDLKRQISFDFPINGKPMRYVDSKRVMKYVADFEYIENGVRKIVDVKGFKTRDYLIKRALMFSCHNILITEV